MVNANHLAMESIFAAQNSAVRIRESTNFRSSIDFKEGVGQDDEMPAVPSMSMAAAQLDMQLMLRNGTLNAMSLGNDSLFVSKDDSLQADLYMESDAEEIYLPES